MPQCALAAREDLSANRAPGGAGSRYSTEHLATGAIIGHLDDISTQLQQLIRVISEQCN